MCVEKPISNASSITGLEFYASEHLYVLVHCKYFNCQNTIFALHQNLRHVIVAQSAKGSVESV